MHEMKVLPPVPRRRFDAVIGHVAQAAMWLALAAMSCSAFRWDCWVGDESIVGGVDGVGPGRS